MAVRSHECDNCGREAQGYTRDELEKQGWSWHVAIPPSADTTATFFVMCDSCNGAVEQRAQQRREREQRAAEPRLMCSHCKSDTMVLPAVNVVVGTEFRLALPTSLCRGCDRYPETLRPGEYTDADWAMPDFFFPSST